ncbi:hypothetical protein T484DRAFT_1919737, partial [Baffinella frigidus]
VAFLAKFPRLKSAGTALAAVHGRRAGDRDCVSAAGRQGGLRWGQRSGWGKRERSSPGTAKRAPRNPGGGREKNSIPPLLALPLRPQWKRPKEPASALLATSEPGFF